MGVVAPKLGVLDKLLLKKTARGLSLQRGEETLALDVGLSDASDLPKAPFTDRPQDLSYTFIVVVSTQGLHIAVGSRTASYPWSTIATFEPFQDTYTIGLTNGTAITVASTPSPRPGFVELVSALRAQHATGS